MADFEDFHVVAGKEVSERTAALLRSAGVRIRERVVTEIGHPEYVIAVHPEDVERASEVFSQDLGRGRTFTPGTEPGNVSPPGAVRDSQ